MSFNKFQNIVDIFCDVLTTLVLFVGFIVISGITMYCVINKEFIVVMVGVVSSLSVLAAFLGVVCTIIDRRRKLKEIK